jgi:hypothetical protein
MYVPSLKSLYSIHLLSEVFLHHPDELPRLPIRVIVLFSVIVHIPKCVRIVFFIAIGLSVPIPGIIDLETPIPAVFYPHKGSVTITLTIFWKQLVWNARYQKAIIEHDKMHLATIPSICTGDANSTRPQRRKLRVELKSPRLFLASLELELHFVNALLRLQPQDIE